MSATIAELLHIIQEGIRSQDPANAFVIGPQIEDALWKLSTGRLKDLDLSDTLRFKELIKSINHGDKPNAGTSAGN